MVVAFCDNEVEQVMLNGEEKCDYVTRVSVSLSGAHNELSCKRSKPNSRRSHIMLVELVEVKVFSCHSLIESYL